MIAQFDPLVHGREPLSLGEKEELAQYKAWGVFRMGFWAGVAVSLMVYSFIILMISFARFNGWLG